MPDAPKTEAPAVPAAPAAPVPADPGTAPVENAPKWDGDFDADRAARLVANLRGDNDALKAKFEAAQAKVAEYETAQMTDMDKLTQRATTAESELATLRREIAVRDALTEHGLPKDAARFLTGDTAEEIAEAAKAFAALNPAKPAEAQPLPPTLPVPGNGSDPAEVRQLTRDEVERLSGPELLEARRAGRLRNLGA